jgi:hypothetical protein
MVSQSVKERHKPRVKWGLEVISCLYEFYTRVFTHRIHFSGVYELLVMRLVWNNQFELSATVKNLSQHKYTLTNEIRPDLVVHCDLVEFDKTWPHHSWDHPTLPYSIMLTIVRDMGMLVNDAWFRVYSIPYPMYYCIHRPIGTGAGWIPLESRDVATTATMFLEIVLGW